jgi:HlyD family secretion protein
MKTGNLYLALICVSSIVLTQSCKEGEQSLKPEARDITESVYASGTIKASGQYEIFSPYSGILVSNLVKAGDTITPDTDLFLIDNTISALNTENARINAEMLRDKTGPSSNTLGELEKRMSLAREKMLNDSLLLSRQQSLWQQQVGSKIDLEKRELNYKASKTEYESVMLQYRQIKIELEKSYQQALNSLKISEKQKNDFIVRSHLSGTVYNILKEPGEWISAQTPLGVAGQTNKFEIELQVDEFDIVKIKKDQRVFISMDSYKGKSFEGVVTRVEPFMNERTRTFRVFAEFTNAPETLYPNLSVEANILISEKKNALTIPASYLINDKYVITSDNDTVEVKVGIKNLQWAEIEEGIDINSSLAMPQR